MSGSAFQQEAPGVCVLQRDMLREGNQVEKAVIHYAGCDAEASFISSWGKKYRERQGNLSKTLAVSLWKWDYIAKKLSACFT